ncbi:MAG: hypothetical protein HY558_04675 [Euryarchaeota archaeon]|nr:hypothetical protein [Euryarchaeota archaeon]
MAGWVSEVRELLQETQGRLDRLAGHLGEIEEGASRKVDLSRTRQMLAERIREVRGLEEELGGLRVEDLESALRSRDLLLEADLRRAVAFLDSWARTLGTPEAVQQVARRAAEAVRVPLQAWLEEEARVLRASVESAVAARSGDSIRISAEVRAIRGLLDGLREHTAPVEERMDRLEATLQQGVETSLARAGEASLQARGAATAAGQATARAAQAEALMQSILSSLPSAEEVKVRLEGQAASLERLSAEARSLSERLQRLPEALRLDVETAASAALGSRSRSLEGRLEGVESLQGRLQADVAALRGSLEETDTALRRETAGLPARVEVALHQASQATEGIEGLRGQVEGLARRLQEEGDRARSEASRLQAEFSRSLQAAVEPVSRALQRAEAAAGEARQLGERIAGLDRRMQHVDSDIQGSREEEQKARESLVRVLLRHEQALDELPARFPLWEEFEANLQALEQKVSRPPPEPSPPLEAKMEAVAAEVRGQVAALVQRLEALETRPPPPGPGHAPVPDVAIVPVDAASHDGAAPPPRDPLPVSLVDRRGRRGALLTAIAVLDRDYRQGHLKPEEFEASLRAMRAARRSPPEPENPDPPRQDG